MILRWPESSHAALRQSRLQTQRVSDAGAGNAALAGMDKSEACDRRIEMPGIALFASKGIASCRVFAAKTPSLLTL
jgi:hypothetical protein